jgi:hypothetical protein
MQRGLVAEILRRGYWYCDGGPSAAATATAAALADLTRPVARFLGPGHCSQRAFSLFDLRRSPMRSWENGLERMSVSSNYSCFHSPCLLRTWNQ